MLWNELKQKFKKNCEANKFEKVFLGLSGGMDSAFVCILACETLGAENVNAIMMKTQYTSQESLDIAQDLADHYGFSYEVLDIQHLFNEKVAFLNSAFGEDVKQITLENLQARIRGIILMAYSNQKGGIVLACGNKSEIAMGYCTLYGDACGAISPIGSIYKSDLYAMANQLQKDGIYFPQRVLERAPSAELALDQKDEDSLPPYCILDGVLKEYIDEKKSVEAIIQSGYEEGVVRFVIDKYHKSSFKCLQMPPVL